MSIKCLADMLRSPATPPPGDKATKGPRDPTPEPTDGFLQTAGMREAPMMHCVVSNAGLLEETQRHEG